MKKRQKILCVDDEPINLFILQRNFNKNYDVLTAEDGLKALSVLENYDDIELIISDWRMPEMSGLEFIKEANKRFSNKRYFMLSGFAATEEIQQALEAKLICEYFEKPADFGLIGEALQKPC